MNASTSTRADTLASAALVLGLILALGLLAVSYADAVFYLIGVAIALPILVIGRLLRAKSRALGWRRWTLPMAVLALVVVAAAAASFWPRPAEYDGPPLGGPLPIAAVGYTLRIEPVDGRARSFRITQEEVVLADDSRGYAALAFAHPEEVTSRTAGLLRRQVRLDSLLARGREATLAFVDGSSQQVYVEPWYGRLKVNARPDEPLPDGGSFVIVTVCQLTCPTSLVEVRRFPKGSFQKEAGAVYDTTDNFDDTETITWQLARFTGELGFSYVEPRYRWLYPVVRPFLSLSSLGHLVMVLIGVVGPAIVLSILKPALVAVATEALKHWLHGFGRSPWIRRLSWNTGSRARKSPRPRKRPNSR